MKKLSILDVLDRFNEYCKNNPCGGSLHCILDDGNVKDSHVIACIDYATDKGDTEGAELGKILLSMSKTQRLKIGCMVR